MKWIHGETYEIEARATGGKLLITGHPQDVAELEERPDEEDTEYNLKLMREDARDDLDAELEKRLQRLSLDVDTEDRVRVMISEAFDATEKTP